MSVNDKQTDNNKKNNCKHTTTNGSIINMKHLILHFLLTAVSCSARIGNSTFSPSPSFIAPTYVVELLDLGNNDAHVDLMIDPPVAEPYTVSESVSSTLNNGQDNVKGANIPEAKVNNADKVMHDAVPQSGELIPGLLGTNDQPMFVNSVPNSLDPSFMFRFDPNNTITVQVCKSDRHVTGLIDKKNRPRFTTIYGYGSPGGPCTWPGMTLEIQANTTYYVHWENKLPKEPYLITGLDGTPVLDKSLHWAYSLHGYESYTIEADGVPIVVHLHGGHTNSPYDGNPEFFFSPDFVVKGPQWVAETYKYKERKATLLWYHDHTIGITRLNVYAGMAGLVVVRDEVDTGKYDNPLNLPVWPYELAYLIQDRMFKDDGLLFYPAFPGDPSYRGFIDDESVTLSPEDFESGGPTSLAEFFGDIMTVNGIIWPKTDVEPRQYRLRLANACDSRFLIIQFVQVDLDARTIPSNAQPLPFTVIGSDQGLAFQPRVMDTLVFEPGSRYDLIVNFSKLKDSRVIMKNIGPDEPFGGEYETEGPAHGSNSFSRTDRIMAFDVVKDFEDTIPDKFNVSSIKNKPDVPEPTRVRKVGLFEGRDQYNRLLPLLGTVEPATDYQGNPIYWPNLEAYQKAGLAGKVIEGTAGWHDPITENPALGSTEEWEVWNMSEDAHPVHVHLVSFELLGRNEIIWDSALSNDDHALHDESSAVGDGTYLVKQSLVQHDGSIGIGYRVVNPTMGKVVTVSEGYFENGPLDVVVALPGQVTRFKATFDKPGRYAWHCHILSHEDHEMMRVLHVGPQKAGSSNL